MVSVDGIPDAKKAVKAGDMYATIAQHPELMAQLSVQTAKKLTDKQPVDSVQKLPVDPYTKDSP